MIILDQKLEDLQNNKDLKIYLKHYIIKHNNKQKKKHYNFL